MKSILQVYAGDGFVVRFDPRICIHSGECVTGLPSVFDTSARPWVDVTGADELTFQAQIARCPSGALSFGKE